MIYTAYQSREAKHVTTPRHPEGYDIAVEWAVKNKSGLIIKRFEGSAAQERATSHALYLNSASRAAYQD